MGGGRRLDALFGAGVGAGWVVVVSGDDLFGEYAWGGGDVAAEKKESGVWAVFGGSVGGGDVFSGEFDGFRCLNGSARGRPLGGRR